MRFRILGPVQVVQGSRAVEFASRHQRLLLATLLSRANHAVPVDRLVEAIWDSVPPRTAIKNVQVYVHQLRRSLDESRIVRHPHGYAIVVEDGELDADVFQELARAGASAIAAGEVLKGRSLLSDALDLWRGAAFGDLATTAALREPVARLSEERLRVLEERIDADLLLGDHQRVVGELGALVLEQPMRERLRGQQMIALYRSGRQAEALEAYHVARQVLAEELGVEPTDPLQRIHLAILRGHDPGPGFEKVAAPRVVAPPVPAQLPGAVPYFAGRRAQLATLDGLLQDAGKDPVLCVISGLGGIGKTAMAIHWAHQVRDRFPDGQLYLNLHGHSGAPPVDPGIALATLLRALGVPPLDIPSEVDAAAALYRTVLIGHKILVVLDNAADADQIRHLIPAGQGVLTLVTSRSRMSGLVALDGAVKLDLDVLSHAEARLLLCDLLGPSRVNAEPVSADELTEACDRLPLALRIAAAHVSDQPRLRLSDFVAGLAKDRLEVLAIPDDARVSVPATFGYSYHVLPGPARELFRLMGLSPGRDLTVSSAAVLAGITQSQARPLLARLAAASLIDERDPGRYSMHDLVREFAVHVANAEDSAAYRHTAIDRYLRWYLAAIAQAAKAVNPVIARVPAFAEVDETSHEPFASLDSATAWLDAERHNIGAIISQSAELGRHELSWIIVDALRAYFYHRSLIGEYHGHAKVALRDAQNKSDEPGQAAAQLALGTATRLLSSFDPAADHFRRAVHHAEVAGWLPGLASAHVNLAESLLNQAQPQLALDHLKQAFDIDEAANAVGGLVANHTITAGVYRALGRLDEAEHHDAQVESLARDLGVDMWIARSTLGHGLNARQRGDFTQAIAYLERGRAMFASTGNQYETGCMGLIADINLDMGRFGEAERLVMTALSHRAEAIDRAEQRTIQCRQGRLLRLTGEPRRAQELLAQLLTPQASASMPALERLTILLELTSALLDLGCFDDAAGHLAQARQTMHTGGIVGMMADADTLAARLALGQGRQNDARALATHAVEVAAGNGQRPQQVRALIVLGDTLETDAAQPHLLEALRIATDLGMPEADQLRSRWPEIRPPAQAA